jgi:hypothetical protein
MMYHNDTTHLMCSELYVDIVFKPSLERDLFTDLTLVSVIEQCDVLEASVTMGADPAPKTSCCVY